MLPETKNFGVEKDVFLEKGIEAVLQTGQYPNRESILQEAYF